MTPVFSDKKRQETAPPCKCRTVIALTSPMCIGRSALNAGVSGLAAPPMSREPSLQQKKPPDFKSGGQKSSIIKNGFYNKYWSQEKILTLSLHKTVVHRDNSLYQKASPEEQALLKKRTCFRKSFFWRCRADLNCRMKVLQTFALPLGHGTGYETRNASAFLIVFWSG